MTQKINSTRPISWPPICNSFMDEISKLQKTQEGPESLQLIIGSYILKIPSYFTEEKLSELPDTVLEFLGILKRCFVSPCESFSKTKICKFHKNSSVIQKLRNSGKF